MTIIISPLELIVLIAIVFINILLLIVQSNQLAFANKKIKVMQAIITLLTDPNDLLNHPRWKESPKNDK